MSDRKIAKLRLPFPWVPENPVEIDTLILERGREPTLTYVEDQLSLRVEVLDPHRSAHELVATAKSPPPGNVVLVAGDVPLDLRPTLRQESVSFLDIDGTAELFWPRLRVSASRLTDDEIQRHTPALTLRGAHSRIVQTLLASWIDRDPIQSGTDLAERAETSEASTSRALRKFAEHGLVQLVPEGRAHRPEVVDPVALAETLRDERGWPQRNLYFGYRYGRDAQSRATELARASDDARIELATTGITAAVAFGVLTTALPPVLKIWIRAEPSEVPRVLQRLEIEPVDREEANCAIALDKYRLGTLGAQVIESKTGYVWISHPIRVWCDLKFEPRGADVAAQLWQAIT